MATALRVCCSVLLALLTLLAGLPAAAHAGNDLAQTYTLAYQAGDAGLQPAQVGKVKLQKGQRYRLEISGKVDLQPFAAYDNLPHLTCDGVWCKTFGEKQPTASDGEASGVVQLGWYCTHSTNTVSKFTKQKIAYEEDGSYEVVFKAAHTDVLLLDGLGNLYSRDGTVTVKLFDADEDTLKIDWELKPRLKRERDDSIDYPRTAEEVKIPDESTVFLTVETTSGKACDEHLQYRWRIDGRRTSLFHRTDKADADCEWVVRLDTGQPHVVDVSAKRGRRRLQGDELVEYRDFLIVGVGDSAGSGEGVPLYRGLGRHYAWENARCHRSPYSQQAIAAERVEDANKHSVVTFVHLACSGATVPVGLTGGYEGIEPDSPDLPAQVLEMLRLAGERKIDALQISIGVNEAEFGSVVSFCVDHEQCPTATYKDDMNMATFVTTHLGVLPGEYSGLSDQLAVVMPRDHVYLTHYPDLLRDEKGKLCASIVSVPGGAVDADEITWLDRFYAGPLSAAVSGAGKLGWHVVSGARAAFRTHGYCSEDRWVRRLTDSLVRQFDSNGAMHPNYEGHAVLGGLSFTALKRDLLPGGKPRPATPGTEGPQAPPQCPKVEDS